MADIERVVVVVPAHNELEHLPRSLRALTTAALCMPVPVVTVVVLDACDDGSERLAGRYGADVHFVSVDAGCVGAARAAGFDYAREHCPAAVDRTWYATTDADSVVDAQWLPRMTSADADMVLGIVRIPAWRHFPAAVARRYLLRTTRKAKATTTFTAQTWASALTRTGVSGAFVHSPRARTSSWSSGSRLQACASTVTPSWWWRRRIDATAGRLAASRSTCAT